MLRFELDGRPLFLKLHRGVGWKEVFKNLVQLKWPVTGARNEWVAIRYLQAYGVQTMSAVGYGSRGINPASRLSFLVTEELTNTVTLENHCREWSIQTPPFAHRLKIIRRVADIAQRMHSAGVNHRDFYLCHFLLAHSESQRQGDVPPELFLVDLHRAQIRNAVPRRWRVKDIGSLYYSALEIGLTPADLLRFVRLYTGKSLRHALLNDRKFWQKVEQRAIQLYIKAHGIKPPKLKGISA